MAFNKHRAHIESVASAKYDRGEIDHDGRTILVSAADIETHLSERGSTASATANSDRMTAPTSYCPSRCRRLQ